MASGVPFIADYGEFVWNWEYNFQKQWRIQMDGGAPPPLLTWKYFSVSRLFRYRRHYSLLRAFAINDDAFDALSSASHFQNFLICR